MNDHPTVWAVQYSNYEPMEIDSLWSTQELAEKYAEKLNDATDSPLWDVTEKHVHDANCSSGQSLFF